MVERRIGIIGGGQLGRMMTPDAKRLGFEVTVIDPTPNSPASQMGAEQIQASLTDAVATRRLAGMSDFLTVEIEHVNTDVLKELVQEGVTINPSPETLDRIKDKLRQKEFLQSLGIPVAPFQEVTSEEDIIECGEKFSYPFVLKSRFGAYDGRGNFVIRKKEDIQEALQKFGDTPLYVEQFIPFQKELAIMVAKGMQGDTAMYPVVETIHKDNICDTVLVPAPINKAITDKVYAIANCLMEGLTGAGVFGIEMFLTSGGEVIVNEVAPRVHNSGHYTIEAASTSQFEQHIRAITGLPLGNTDMKVPAAVMINILGQKNGEVDTTGLDRALAIPNVAVHLYGKTENKPQRKMGHITAWGESLEIAEKSARQARNALRI